MASYLLLGAGRFGRLALQRLAWQDPAAGFLMVDTSSLALTEARALANHGVQWVEAEAITFLAENLREDAPWDWIIPMVPVHVAVTWLRRGPLAGCGWEAAAVPDAVAHLAPQAIPGGPGELYLSRATHLCPDDCPEPDTTCPVSGESRESALYDELASLQVPGFPVMVVASRPLAPGVGGYSPRRLMALAQDMSGCTGKVLIATACRCHGVVQALEHRPGGLS